MILELWKGITEKMNTENKCGFCWEFYAPLTGKKLNIVRGDDECCVKVFLLRNMTQDFGSRITYTSGFHTNTNNFDNYKVLFLISSKEGINNYNELEGWDISKSRHETIFKPLRNCIESEILTDICSNFEVTNWTGKYIYDYQDENYYGIEITINQNYNER